MRTLVAILVGVVLASVVGAGEARAAKILSGVPHYNQDWFDGDNDCAPTAAEMVLGYHDSNGWPRLIPWGNSSFASNPIGVQATQTLLKGTMGYKWDWGTSGGIPWIAEQIGSGISSAVTTLDPGASFSTNLDWWTSWSGMKANIDGYGPMIFLLAAEATYYWNGDPTDSGTQDKHATTMIGYAENEYHVNATARWVVVDMGWTDTTPAWINYDATGDVDSVNVYDGGSPSGNGGLQCDWCSSDGYCQYGGQCDHWSDYPAVAWCSQPCIYTSDCPANMQCSSGVCWPKVNYSCRNGDVWKKDTCGNWIALVDSCGASEECVEGASTCQSTCACTSGTCCDGCNYRSSGYKCQEDANTEYYCKDGTGCGQDVYVHHQDRYCSGSSSSCNGSLLWDTATVYDNCASTETCSPGDSSCNYTASCDCECTSGTCCDGCNYRSSGYKCQEDINTEYYCKDGTGCGQDVYVHHQDRYCSGSSSSCNGSLQWDAETVYDNCSSSETCSSGQSSCMSTPSCSCVCSSGVCCDGCNYRSSSNKCQEDVTTEYYCKDGTGCGQDVYVHHQDRYCSGSSSSCDGSLQWDAAVVSANCGSGEKCENGQLSCTVSSQCSCQPSCSGKQCGDNGCGGSCGSCPAGKSCSGGSCVGCSPNCGGKACGDDGCGGTCGTCASGKNCSGGSCVGCSPNCAGRECGDDGCGGTCGSCQAGRACASGSCVGCSPACSGKECGDDGCGGSCGSCDSEKTCQSGVCKTASTGGKPDGDGCSSDQECENGLCSKMPGEGNRYCRKPCSVMNKICPQGSWCICYGQDMKGACMPGGGKAALAEPCSAANDCISDICFTDDEARGGYCTVRCCNGCPDDMACGTDTFGDSVCLFAAAQLPDPGTAGPDTGSGGPGAASGGCVASPFTNNPFWVVPAVWLALVFLIRRRSDKRA